MKYVQALFTHFYTLPDFHHNQKVANITICCPEWLDVKYTWMSSPVY
jgi:hypothetical protein